MMKEENTEILRLLGDKLKKLREEKGLSQATLSYDANIPRNQVGRIERGEISTSISNLYKLAKALNIQVKDLIDF
ncbi:helix-turn-helix transcriptional regulator [Flavobacterium salilacus subsp. salilacus]|uniref:helix-turn-helix domain-containing protein n=1 Tax=Flavobacterium TaxID=237 RepID=UPI001074B527|nr:MULTISPECIES: helix-turn-helix transcriptional regulator [Flavobacterium]KAF2518122.1 helix-turn-helix transcriptional regulator [Flavobacterium salilacus subsp. salilacus]MBE1615568.1 helix-turn-helix transcriptional regulator [Flavobacterium sp. SaA2.13]